MFKYIVLISIISMLVCVGIAVLCALYTVFTTRKAWEAHPVRMECIGKLMCGTAYAALALLAINGILFITGAMQLALGVQDTRDGSEKVAHIMGYVWTMLVLGAFLYLSKTSNRRSTTSNTEATTQEEKQ